MLSVKHEYDASSKEHSTVLLNGCHWECWYFTPPCCYEEERSSYPPPPPPVPRSAEEASCRGLALSRGVWFSAQTSGVRKLSSHTDGEIVAVVTRIHFVFEGVTMDNDFFLLCCVHRDLCSLYRQDQEICAAVLPALLPSVRSLGRTQHLPDEMIHVQGALLKVVSGFWLVP